MSDQQPEPIIAVTEQGTCETAPPSDAPISTYDDDLVAAVTAAQLSVCTQIVPAAVQLRLAAAAQVPAGQWRRTAGNDDPKVQALEAPYKRLAPATAGSEPKPRKKAAAKKATGANRRRSTTTQKEK